MKVVSAQPRKQRMFKSTHKHRPLWIEPVGSGWWYLHETNEWVHGYENAKGKHCSSSFYASKNDGVKEAWSIKAAKRRIAKWNVPKGTKFNVGLPYVGYDFIISKP